MNKPEAHILADLSHLKEEFEISQSFASYGKPLNAFQSIPYPSADIKAKADNAVKSQILLMKVDEIAQERYYTALQTRPNKDRKFQSAHPMFLDAAEERPFHYHPPAEGHQEASDRIVFVLPLWNRNENQGGVTFEWFATKNNFFVQDMDNHSPVVVRGVADAPMYRAHIGVGQVAVLRFGAGAHRFIGGDTLAISMHTTDIDRGMSGDALINNTTGFAGEQPYETEIIELQKDGYSQNAYLNGVSLQELFTNYLEYILDYIRKRDVNEDFSDKEFGRFIRALREYGLPEQDIADDIGPSGVVCE